MPGPTLRLDPTVGGDRMEQLPTGTLTFLFTDIEGSTTKVAELGIERWTDVLRAHARILRQAIADGSGIEVHTEGDAFFAVFPRAPGAIEACARAQQALFSEPWPQGVEVRVRMGLHAGQAALGGADTGVDYIGLDVHRAARVAAAGHGGQVLLSAAVAALIEGALPDNVIIRDLGEHRLKDIARPERLYQLVIDGLPREFPPLRTLDRVPHQLPVQVTSFVGREHELAEIGRLLEGARLLTLTGPGGTGKTRLAVQSAAEAVDAFPDGVFFADLSPIADATLVPAQIARALHLQLQGQRGPLEQITEHLRDRRALLVLDNFEQVLPAATVVSEVLRQAPRVTVIATSRIPLRVYGEQHFEVPPLAVGEGTAADPDAAAKAPAVRLFVERAVASRPSFALTADNVAAVVAICARLDGLPLAIELAAARVKALAPREILTRLESRLAFLTAGMRDLPERQRTLRGAIDWSYDMLEPGTKRLFERCAVFVGGAAIEQIEVVCGPDEEVGGDVLDGLSALVEQSLVRHEDETDATRYRMLETIREYALERLEASGEATQVRGRHAGAYAALAEEIAPRVLTEEQKPVLDRFEREHANLRAALDHALAARLPELASGIAVSCWRYWQMRGHLAEGRSSTDAVLGLVDPTTQPRERIAALEAAGGIVYWQGDMERAQAHYAEQVSVARQVADRAAVANALYNLAFAYLAPNKDVPKARPLLDEAAAIFRELGDEASTAKALRVEGSLLVTLQDYEAARPVLLEAEDLFRRLQDRFNLAWTLNLIGAVAMLSRPRDAAAARRGFTEGLRLFAESHDATGVPLVLANFSALAEDAGDHDRAVRLAGAAHALAKRAGFGLSSFVAPVIPIIQEAQIGETDRGAWAEGLGMETERAVAYALGAEAG